MFYSFQIPVAVGRTEANPVEEELNLTYGVIVWVGVQFPVGCAELVHCRLLHRRHQVWPSNINESLQSDGYTVPIDEHYRLDEPPFIFTAICWNDDDTYDHTVTVFVDILESTLALLIVELAKGLSRFLKLVGIKV